MDRHRFASYTCLLAVISIAIGSSEVNNGSHCPCRNGGTCAADWNPPTQTECFCAPGFTGKECETREQRCPAHLNDCAAGSHCRLVNNQKECVCSAAQFGPRCELPNPCVLRTPCRNGGTCSVRLNAYTPTNVSFSHNCRCAAGYQGANCERDVDECAHKDFKLLSACVHGRCVNTPGSFHCECLTGFQGRMCELPQTPCDSYNPCRNGGTCQKRRRRVHCACTASFAGEFCEVPMQTHILNQSTDSTRPTSTLRSTAKVMWLTASQNTVKSTSTYASTLSYTKPTHRNNKQLRILNYEEQLKSCAANQCNSKQNGRCDTQCLTMACDYDNGECSFGIIPFKQCSAESAGFERPCDQVFADGLCDEHCNSEECLYDGFDCARSNAADFPLLTRCSSPRCLIVYSDNVCDFECNVPECAWDGGDCAQFSALDGNLAVRLSVKHASELDLAARNTFLRRLSARTNLVARMKSSFLVNDSQVQWLIQFDTSHCDQQRNCFRNLQNVAQLFVAHLLAGNQFSSVTVSDAIIVETDSRVQVASTNLRATAASSASVAPASQLIAEDTAVLIYALVACFVCWLLAGTSIMLAVLWQANKRRKNRNRAARVRRKNERHDANHAHVHAHASKDTAKQPVQCSWQHDVDDRIRMCDYDVDDERVSLKDCSRTEMNCCNCADELTLAPTHDSIHFLQKDASLDSESPRRVHFLVASTEI